MPDVQRMLAEVFHSAKLTNQICRQLVPPLVMQVPADPCQMSWELRRIDGSSLSHPSCPSHRRLALEHLNIIAWQPWQHVT